MIAVGPIAPANRCDGETPCPKNFFSSEMPAGLGAFAMMVRPPPVRRLRVAARGRDADVVQACLDVAHSAEEVFGGEA